MCQMVRPQGGKTRFFARIAQSLGLMLLCCSPVGCDSKQPLNTAQSRPATIWEEFSGEKALAHVKAMVDFGPRPPGTDAIEKTRGYLTRQLESLGWVVTRQTFINDTPRGNVEFVNLIATFGEKESHPSFLLCSHYDTKT